jgi:two-component system, NtrC family, sensor kinase
MTDTVLIVDDSLTVRMDLTEAFEAAGFRTLPCGTMAEALEVLARTEVAVAVLDVLLPDGNGIDLLKEVRASASRHAAVLMLSSEAEVKDRVHALSTGADEYVGKPYDTSYVIAKARELLRARSRSPGSERATVLVIDDSLTFRSELTSTLERAGYRVIAASSGEEGLRRAAEQRPSAVVVDGVLPGIDGATVIRRMRLDAALRAVPCLLLTASEDREAELTALDAGADAFVRKADQVEDLLLAKLAAALRGAATSTPETVSLLGPHKVLAVDDSSTYLNAVGECLREEGYEVALARSGEEALELLAVQAVDCILLDLMMPGLGGKETCRRIKAAPVVRDTPLILLTSVEDRSTMLEGLAAGADDFIPKSSELDVVKARVRAQIRRKQFEDENRRIRDQLLQQKLEATEARAARDLAETRAELIAELERKNRELEAFSYSVSHDLRAPLRSIDGFSQALLEDQLERLDARGQRHLHQVRKSAQRMAELIDDLLELSRVSRGELHRTSSDLSALARDVASELQRREPDRDVELVIAAGLHAEVDARLLRIVFENLLGNAWKFTRKVQLARIEVGQVPSPEGNTFFVRDNGAGFAMHYADKLFRPFQRLHTEAEFPGTGIGLATIQRIIDRHGGRAWAEGEIGHGAVFYFTVSQRSLLRG